MVVVAEIDGLTCPNCEDGFCYEKEIIDKAKLRDGVTVEITGYGFEGDNCGEVYFNADQLDGFLQEVWKLRFKDLESRVKNLENKSHEHMVYGADGQGV